MRPELRTTEDGVAYRDLNGNGRMDPYEDPRLPVEERVEDLLARLSLEEKVGLMFQTVIEAGADGTVLEQPGAISKSPTSTVVLEKHLTHFNVHALDDPRMAARWSNALQALAERTPHGIPVTVSTDPRHAFIENVGVSFSAGAFSQWPEPLGLAALRDADAVRRFADIARQEYVAVGIRAALHPTLDLATEPRWARQAGTFGQDPDLVTELGVAYLKGFQGDSLGPGSVACTSKHFPGGGPQKDGEDAHFPYGREQVYPGGRFADHLKPFPPIIEAGTAGIMPYYGMPIDLDDRRRGDRADRFRLQQAGRHRACSARSSATTASSSPTGSSSTTTTSATRFSRPAPGASSTSTRTAGWSSSSRPAPTSSAARSASTSCSTSSRRAGSPRHASTSRPGASSP